MAYSRNRGTRLWSSQSWMQVRPPVNSNERANEATGSPPESAVFPQENGSGKLQESCVFAVPSVGTGESDGFSGYSGPIGLLDLPPEIRMEIWELVLSEIDQIWPCGCLDKEVTCSHDHQTSDIAMRLLAFRCTGKLPDSKPSQWPSSPLRLINRLINEEAHQVGPVGAVRRAKTLHLCSRGCMIALLERMTRAGGQQIGAIEFHHNLALGLHEDLIFSLENEAYSACWRYFERVSRLPIKSDIREDGSVKSKMAVEVEGFKGPKNPTTQSSTYLLEV